MNRALVFAGMSIVILLSGCGKLSSTRLAKTITKNLPPFGLADSKSVTLDLNSEVPVAIRICTALKQKRTDLEKRLQASEKISYMFKYEKRNCANVATSAVQNITSALMFASNVLDFDNENPAEFMDVITENVPALASICKAALDTTDDHTKISNVIPVTVSSQYSVVFTSTNNVDSFYYLARNKDASGSFKVTSADIIVVDTTAASKSYGVSKERSHLVPCDTANQFTTTKETWVSAVTPL